MMEKDIANAATGSGVFLYSATGDHFPFARNDKINDTWGIGPFV